MPVFFIHSEQIQKGLLQITGPLRRHLAGSLRHRAGDRILVVDERKVGYTVQLLEMAPTRITAKVLEEKEERGRSADSSLEITLGLAILKAGKLDWVLQKATELGVARIIPIVTEKTIARPRPERQQAQHHRWQEILKEAAQQSGRWEIPSLELPSGFARLAARGPAFDLVILPWEGETEKGLKEVLRAKRQARKILVLIGPEGGFSEQEVTLAEGHQAVCVSLGPRTMRADTAALATLAMLQFELGDTGLAV